MVRDSVLWHCHSPGGHGKSEWGNSRTRQAVFFLLNLFVLLSTVFLSIGRENTHNIGRTQKTTFISCRQTHLFMTPIRRPVLLPARWAHTHTHAITVTSGIFIGPPSCGRHDRDLTHVSEQSVTQCSESALTQGSSHFVPTQTLLDRDLPFVLIAQTECMPTLFRCNYVAECEEAFQLLFSHPHVHTQYRPASSSLWCCHEWAPQGHFGNQLNKHPTTLFTPYHLNSFSPLWFTGPIQEGLWKK